MCVSHEFECNQAPISQTNLSPLTDFSTLMCSKLSPLFKSISRTNSDSVTVSTLPVESGNLRLPLPCLKSGICLECQQNGRLFCFNFKQFTIKTTSESHYIRIYYVQIIIKQLTWRGISSNHTTLASTSSM